MKFVRIELFRCSFSAGLHALVPSYASVSQAPSGKPLVQPLFLWLPGLQIMLAEITLTVRGLRCDNVLRKSAGQPLLLAGTPEVPGTCTCQVYCPCGSSAAPAGASDPSPPPCLPPAPSSQPGSILLTHSMQPHRWTSVWSLLSSHVLPVQAPGSDPSSSGISCRLCLASLEDFCTLRPAHTCLRLQLPKWRQHNMSRYSPACLGTFWTCTCAKSSSAIRTCACSLWRLRARAMAGAGTAGIIPASHKQRCSSWSST